jgi:hypothetical protein
MAWELLVDDERGTGVFTCNTVDIAFGPLVTMHNADVGTFYEWWSEVIGTDPRLMWDDKSHLLNAAVYRWYGIQYDIKFQISLPSGKVFHGEYYPVDYCSIKGIYDDDVSEEMHEDWAMEDWDNMMASVFKNRECDMDGDGGEMSGYLFPTHHWDEEQREYVMNEIQTGPKWEIVGLKNAYEKIGWSNWSTWEWFKDGESIGTGDEAPWIKETPESKD